MFNKYLARTYGIRLPLGRHSISNSVGIPFHASKEDQEKAAEALFKFLKVAGSIEDWGALRARVLFESVRTWHKEQLIPLGRWEAKFHLSKLKASARSEQAFKDYLEVDSFEKIQTFRP
jgi:hypothetical protein